MPGPIKQFIDFKNNTNADTGENNTGSIQPIVNGENVDQTVLQRPSESLRQRTEAVRNVETDSLYLLDSDRSLIIAGPGRITWPGSTTAAATGIPVLSDNLYLLPMLTPGFAQAAPIPPVASAFGRLHLKRASDSMDSIVVTSLRRSYAAGDQINVVVSAGLVFSCVLDVETTYQRTIRIVATGTTTLSVVIAALAALTPTGPVGDTTPIVTAALEGGALGTDLLLTTQARQYMSGNYDGEGHTITPANLASFFVSNPLQALAEGDTLCVNYAMVTDTASTGGRRQAIPENANTAIPAGAYFNSRSHPENLVNALPICKVVNGNLVFSTGIEVIAGDVNVPLSSISNGSAIIRNPGFEHGVTLSTARFGITDWENRADLAVNGAFRLNTTTPSSGAKQLEFNQTNIAAATGRIEQEQEIPVNPGQNLRVRIAIRQLIAPTAGSYAVVCYWGDANSTASGNTSTALQVLASVDLTYRVVSAALVVPAGKRFLKVVTVEVIGVTLGAPGVSVLFDDLQVTVETQANMTPAVDNALMKPAVVDALIVEDPALYALGQLAALLRMDKSTPAEGRLILERKDQDYSGANLPPALAQFGRLFQLGSKLLGTEANSLIPRVSADFSAVAGVDFTLMWESGRFGETTGGYTQPVTRLYVSNDGQWAMTSNAVWGGATWTKDVAGQSATKQGLAKDGVRLYTRVSDVAWSDTAWADTMHFTNPLETASDAYAPRISMTGYEGATQSEVTQILAFSFAGYTARVYAGHDGGNPDFVGYQLTFNARWNGSNWVKDTALKVSTRVFVQMLGASPADPSRLQVFYQTCLTTSPFPDTDWTASPTTTTLKNSGGELFTGFVFAGPSSGNPNPQGRLTAQPEGFGDGVTASTFFVDSAMSIDTPNFFVDQFGNRDSHGAAIFEEFFDTGAPSGWQSATSGAGVVNYNYNGVSRARLNPGAVDSAGVRTNAQVVQAAYGSFHAEVLWENVLGKIQIGLCDTGASPDVAFLQDSGTYGDENLRVVLRTGAGLQVHDTGLNISTIVNDWVKLRAFARGGTGLLTTTSLFWSCRSKKGSASGVFTPGGAVVNPTVGRVWRADAQNGSLFVVERVGIGGQNNFAL
jgi:hypothetical protein